MSLTIISISYNGDTANYPHGMSVWIDGISIPHTEGSARTLHELEMIGVLFRFATASLDGYGVYRVDYEVKTLDTKWVEAALTR